MGWHRYLKLILIFEIDLYSQHNRDLVLEEHFLHNTGQKAKHACIIFLKNENRDNTIIGKIIKISRFKNTQNA